MTRPQAGADLTPVTDLYSDLVIETVRNVLPGLALGE